MMTEAASVTGLAGLWAQADGVGRSLLLVMLGLSLLTWYLIVSRAIVRVAMARRSQRFLDLFWGAPNLAAVERQMGGEHPAEPFGHLAYHALLAVRHHREHGAHRLDEAGTIADFLTRTLRKVIDEERARLESGLVVLATIGSVSPFVGLFGTVWGVYHALIRIGASGQASLDQIAGPVGEALLMTAIGLAVAIPAVVAYNTLVRRNRVVLGRLDTFAHDLFTFLTTGAPLTTGVGSPGEARVVALKTGSQGEGA